MRFPITDDGGGGMDIPGGGPEDQEYLSLLRENFFTASMTALRPAALLARGSLNACTRGARRALSARKTVPRSGRRELRSPSKTCVGAGYVAMRCRPDLADGRGGGASMA